MTEYRRNRVPGGTYFFTVNLHDRRSDLLVTQIDALRAAVLRIKQKRPFHIDACVILPDHLHCLWTLPPGDTNFSVRWQAIKMDFSRKIPNGEPVSPSRARKRERAIWQRRFWEHTIRDDEDYALHMDYIHFNPVKHGLVTRAADWPHSSFHQAVKKGLYPPQWATDRAEPNDTGEPEPPPPNNNLTKPQT